MTYQLDQDSEEVTTSDSDLKPGEARSKLQPAPDCFVDEEEIFKIFMKINFEVIEKLKF